ncbi:MAG: hypothetical protein, partial [Olavius algarvensis Gamma 1 endosymbiont]
CLGTLFRNSLTVGSLKKINNLFIKDIFHGYCLTLPAREARSARWVVRGRRRRERLAEVAKGP